MEDNIEMFQIPEVYLKKIKQKKFTRAQSKKLTAFFVNLKHI